MRGSKQFRMAGAAGLGALVAASMLAGQARPAQAQARSAGNAGDAPVVPRSDAISGRTGAADLENESRMLIAHGLEMTIEGSTLQGMAMRSAGVNVGQSVDPRPSPAGAVGSSSVGTTTAPANAAIRTPSTVSTAGTGFTGAPGETVSGRPVGNGDEIKRNTPVAGLPEAPQPGGQAPASGVSVAPLNAGQAVADLQKMAVRSFEAGERLLNQGMAAGSPDQKLQKAAARYAGSLRSIASEPMRRTSSIGTGSTEAIGADPASVALINHGVREAIGAAKIRHMIRQMNGTTGPAGQQLMEHAQMMESESRSMIRAFAGTGEGGSTPTASGLVGSPNGAVAVLAQQANELISALQNSNTVQNPGNAR